jgi:DNA-directed RNA polymerase specialized sigma subunit
MRLSKEEYREAEGCLKRFNYNCVTILNIRADIMGLGAMNMDGLPKAKYNISDNVVDSVIKLQEDVELQKVTKEYKVVIQAIELVSEDSKFIFEEYYKKGKGKWEIIDKMGVSEETYKRRRKDLIYTVNKEIKKLT